MPVSEIASPALDAQTADPAELRKIASDQCRLFMNRMRGDQQVQRADGFSRLLEPRPDLTVCRRGLGWPIEDHDVRQEGTNG